MFAISPVCAIIVEKYFPMVKAIPAKTGGAGFKCLSSVKDMMFQP
jgi:hypothetical protein